MLRMVRRTPDEDRSQGPFYDQERARELFGAVKRTVFPSLYQNGQSPTRIWVVGCGAGEVVYSLATMWVDFLERAGASDRAFRVFGTDTNDGAIAAAREGRYDKDIRNLISAAHLEHFFAPTQSGYRVLLGLRERCVFGQHDIFNDAVFSMMDLIVCCSPWLGLPRSAQQRVWRGFRAALRTQRWLILGSGQTDSLPGFDCLDPQHGIFLRTAGPGTNEVPASDGLDAALLARLDAIADELSPGDRDLPGAILGNDLTILRFRGRTGAYFEPTLGALGFHALDMVRGEIHGPLREALDEARTRGLPAQRVAICRSERLQHSVEIEVVPFSVDSLQLLLVRFREQWAGEHPSDPRHRALKTAIAALDARTDELLATREELDTVRERLDCARQEIAVLTAEMAGRSAASERLSDDSLRKRERMHRHIALESALVDQRERRRAEAPKSKCGYRSRPRQAISDDDGEQFTMSVLIVDDHRLMREGLKAILAHAGVEIAGEAGTGRDAIALYLSLRPSVVLMDISMADLNGIEATRALRARAPEAKVLMLSMHADRRYVTASFDAGAIGYVVKTSASEELIQAVAATERGERFVSPALDLDGLARDGWSGEMGTDGESKHELTPREREVLSLLTEGNSSKQIASALNLGVATVETHRRQLMRKLRLRTVAELTKYAIREGLTSLDTPT
jgi:DNA-binding NarL/FixJ family response regulator